MNKDPRIIITRLMDILGQDGSSYFFPGLPGGEDHIIPESDSDIRFRVCDHKKPDLDDDFFENESLDSRNYSMAVEREASKEENDAEVIPDILLSTVDEDTAADMRREMVLSAIGKIQKEYGVTIEELEMMLSYSVKPSRLRVTDSGQIYLVDYDNQEVKMDPLTKTVFLLYLKHPEGIGYKDISDYRGEIETIYGRISRSGDPEAISRSLDLLCNPVESNSLNEKVSRVKRAFINAKDERIAKHYYIDGPAGGIRRIPLDRGLVIWG